MTSTKRKFPLMSTSHGTELAKVVVGKDANQRTFLIHRNLLAQPSEYFNRALKGKFKESSDGVIVLSNHDPLAFEVVYQFLYSGRKTSAAELIDSDESLKAVLKDPEGCSLLWIRCFKLADEIMLAEHPFDDPKFSVLNAIKI